MNKKNIKEWVRSCISISPYNLKIKNLTSSFKDGLVFAAIVHLHLNKSTSNYLWSDVVNATPLQRCQLAFDTAKEVLHVEPLLDAEDIVEYQDEHSIMLYINTIKNRVADTTRNKIDSVVVSNNTRRNERRQGSSAINVRKKKKGTVGMDAYKSRSQLNGSNTTTKDLKDNDNDRDEGKIDNNTKQEDQEEDQEEDQVEDQKNYQEDEEKGDVALDTYLKELHNELQQANATIHLGTDRNSDELYATQRTMENTNNVVSKQTNLTEDQKETTKEWLLDEDHTLLRNRLNRLKMQLEEIEKSPIRTTVSHARTTSMTGLPLNVMTVSNKKWNGNKDPASESTTTTTTTTTNMTTSTTTMNKEKEFNETSGTMNDGDTIEKNDSFVTTATATTPSSFSSKPEETLAILSATSSSPTTQSALPIPSIPFVPSASSTPSLSNSNSTTSSSPSSSPSLSFSEIELLREEVDSLTVALDIEQQRSFNLIHKEKERLKNHKQLMQLINQEKELNRKEKISNHLILEQEQLKYNQHMTELEENRKQERERYTRTIRSLRRTLQENGATLNMTEEDDDDDTDATATSSSSIAVTKLKKKINHLKNQMEVLEDDFLLEIEGRKQDAIYLDEASDTIVALTMALEKERYVNDNLTKICVEQGEEVEILLKSARLKTQNEFHVRRASGYWNGGVDIPPPPIVENEIMDEDEML